MKLPLRTTLLLAAAALMGFSAVTNVFVAVPHLQADLVELHVRSTLLRAVSVALHFGPYAMCVFTLIVLDAGVRAARGGATARLPLAAIAVLYAAFGAAAFLYLGSPHALGYVVAGLLVGTAAALPDR